MNILIDTHIFLWLLFNTKKVKKQHLELLRKDGIDLFLSSISLAEIMIKKTNGKLNVEFDLEFVKEKLQLKILNFDEKSALYLDKLPKHHKDPFDRMIIAQAITNKLKILTYDEKFKLYECELI